MDATETTQSLETNSDVSVGRMKRRYWDDFEWRGIKFLKMMVTAIQADDSAVGLELSCTTQDHNWRGDVWVTVTLKDADGANIWQHRFEAQMQAFCGTHDHVRSTSITSSHFDRFQSASVSVDVPVVARCR